MFDAAEKTGAVVNKWLKDSYGLPLTMSINRLSFGVMAALQEAYDAGRVASLNGEKKESPSFEGIDDETLLALMDALDAVTSGNPNLEWAKVLLADARSADEKRIEEWEYDEDFDEQE